MKYIRHSKGSAQELPSQKLRKTYIMHGRAQRKIIYSSHPADEGEILPLLFVY